MGSDFYELTILGGLDRELHHGASSPSIRCGGSVSRYCARQPAAEDLYCGKTIRAISNGWHDIVRNMTMCCTPTA